MPCSVDSFEYPCSVNNTYYQWTTGGGFSSFVTRPSYQTAAVAKFVIASISHFSLPYLSRYLTTSALMPPQSLFPYQVRLVLLLFSSHSHLRTAAMLTSLPLVTASSSGRAAKSASLVRPLLSCPSPLSAGTSASIPIIAAVAALLNDARRQIGKPVLGFLVCPSLPPRPLTLSFPLPSPKNPLLYKMAATAPGCFNDVIYGDNRCTRYSTCCTYGYGAAPGWSAFSPFSYSFSLIRPDPSQGCCHWPWLAELPEHVELHQAAPVKRPPLLSA